MGPLFCLLSAVGFGVMAVFGKLAYDAGVSVDALLLVRFGLAALVLGGVAAVTGAARGLTRRTVLGGLAMGAVGYALQATFYFSALERLDASLVALVFYLYPVLVMLAAIAVGREQASRRRVAALWIALCGIALVLLGATTGRFDGIGALLALGAAVTYTCYIMVGDRVGADAHPVALTALVCTGGFATFLATGAVTGGTDLAFDPIGWVWLTAIALVSTVGAILLFFAGLARVGPSLAALLSILEPVVTVTGAALVFGETLTLVQLLGGALVLAAVALVQWPRSALRRRGRSGDRVEPATPAPAGSAPAPSGAR
ncbi:DMT family transporter [Nocardioides sp. SYSU DS0651]|uniref:DMT family transporter n=1 Tax=Nocardioides sp. SYSU DS0651 TaxID=3415955 RepID=UPI003F4B357A